MSGLGADLDAIAAAGGYDDTDAVVEEAGQLPWLPDGAVLRSVQRDGELLPDDGLAVRRRCRDRVQHPRGEIDAAHTDGFDAAERPIAAQGKPDRNWVEIRKHETHRKAQYSV